MAIDGIGSKPGTAVSDRTKLRNGRSESTPATDSTTSSTRNNIDQVSLTGTVQQLQSLEARLASMPAYDAAKVKNLKMSLDNGEYQPNPGRIADKIITLEQGLSATSGK